jgi:hypothetical protein
MQPPADRFQYDRSRILISPQIIKPSQLDLLTPEGGELHDAENAKRIHKAYLGLTPLAASDIRLWTYLAHVDQYEYMVKRWPAVRKATAKDPSKYLLAHWFINSATQGSLVRHGLAGLWWAAHLSYDPHRSDPYELTPVLFRQLDLATRTLGTYKLARWKPAVIGILEFILENAGLFKDKFEAKQRFVTKYLNQLGGVKPLSLFEKEYFKSVLDGAKSRISAVA